MKRISLAAVLALGICLSIAGVAHAQDEVIVRTRGPLDSSLVQRHHLTPISSDVQRNLYRLRVPDGTDASSVIASLASEYTVLNAEINSQLTLPSIVTLNQSTVSVLNDTAVTDIAEVIDPSDAVLNASTGAHLDQSTVAVLNSLLTLAPTSFFNTTVSAGMLAQPAMRIIENDAAHRIATGAGVLIADINNGVDTGHEGLLGVLSGGKDFTGAGDVSVFAGLDQSTVSVLNEAPLDLSQSTVAVLNQSTVSVLDGATVLVESSMPPRWGHGTEVAGILHLTAPDAMIMPLKAFTAGGGGVLFNVIEAIYWAADHGAQVINMSFGCHCSSKELSAAIDYAATKGVVLVSSVGNDNSSTPAWPASYSRVMGVAATNFDDTRAAFSNYGGASTFVSAPGSGIITLYPGHKYAAVWGTSFSSPMVAGEAALLLQAGVPALLVPQQIAATAVNNASINSSTYIGRGRIDLFKALGR